MIDLKTLEDRWLGATQVKFATEAGENRNGVRLFRIQFADGTTALYTETMLSSPGVLTSQAQDLTQFREHRVTGVVRECLKTFLDYNLQEKELAYSVQKLEASLVENIAVAQRALWGIENDGEETLQDVDNILTDARNTTLSDVLGEGA